MYKTQNQSFGIDHPLIAVNDIDAVRQRFEQLGFRMTAIGKHPWGTSTTLAMFDGCLIEVMGIYDDSLLDVNPAGDFHFGRHVYNHLAVREGVALSALHSTDIDSDIAHAHNIKSLAKMALSGTLEFGRDVTLPSGVSGRTKTTLALLPDSDFPRLSFFLCQQHRPELIYVPEWMQHANTVYGYAGVSVVAEREQHEALRTKFGAIYGKVNECEGGFSVDTGNGILRVLTPTAIEAEFGKLPQAVLDDLNTNQQPAIVAFDLKCEQLAVLEGFVKQSGLRYDKSDKGLQLLDSTLTGNTFLRFVEG